MRILFRHFRGRFKTWPSLFQEAADFATSVGRESLVNVSHSAEGAEGIVTVWYWGDPDVCPGCGYNLTGNESGRCPECGLTV